MSHEAKEEATSDTLMDSSIKHMSILQEQELWKLSFKHKHFLLKLINNILVGRDYKPKLKSDTLPITIYQHQTTCTSEWMACQT